MSASTDQTMHERTSLDGWHKRLGHPSFKIVRNLVNHFFLPVAPNKMNSLCSSCSINKAHQLPFRPTSFQSHAPLDIIYTDVWGPAHCVGLDGSRYYLIFIDHYTKYIWFYPINAKSCVKSIFPQFKHLVEKRFQSQIKSFTLTMVANTQVSNPFFLFMGLVTIPLPLIHPNKMVFLNVGIAI
jgi:hypothetical protein